MLKRDTEPGIARCIIVSLLAWRNNTQLPILSPNDICYEAHREQSILGYRAFAEGFISPLWSKIQETHFQRLRRRNKGVNWASLLLRQMWDILWSMWETRNELVQQAHLQQTSPEMLALNSQIEIEYEAGFGNLPRQYHRHFSIPLRKMMRKTKGYKQQWILLIHNLRQLHEVRGNESLQRTFIINWLQRFSGR